MKCKKCNKDIDKFEIYCDECKEKLRKNNDEENNRLSSLEQTKILNCLNDLNFENNIDNNLESREETIRRKKSRKRTIIISILLSVLFIIGVSTIAALLLNKSEQGKKDVSPIINYQDVMNKYGKRVERIVKNYLKENNELPNWQQIMELLDYNQFSVVCLTHNLYSDGSIYLKECKIDEEKTEYSYGEEKEEEKEGKKLSIYKLYYTDESYLYTDENNSENKKVGEITCKTEDCKFVKGYDKYVIVKEEDSNYLYDYETDTKEFGPFDLSDSFESENILSDENILYGIYYTKDEINNLYNVRTGKVLKNLKGSLYSYGLYSSPTILYKYNYAILSKDDLNDFINLNTGNISYSIKGKLGKFIEDKKSKFVYITVYENEGKFKIYNSNGKNLFNGKEFLYFNIIGNGLFLQNEKQFYIYDFELNLKLTSKEYDKFLKVDKDYLVVLDKNYLELVNLNDEVMHKFDLEWDDNKYSLSSDLTTNQDGKICIVIEDKSVLNNTLGRVLKYCYTPSTNDVEVVELNSLDEIKN